MVLANLICLATRCTSLNLKSNTVGEGESGMNRKSSTETCTSPYVKERAGGTSLCDAGSSNPVLCDNLEGCDGTYVCPWLIHVDVWQKPTQIGKQLSSN